MDRRVEALTNSTYQVQLWVHFFIPVRIFFEDVQIWDIISALEEFWHRIQIKMISFQNTRQNIAL